MTEDELHALIEGSDPPYTIDTRGGLSYRITDRADLWAPEHSRDMICIVLPGEGIRVLRVNAIECIQLEHEDH